MLVRRLAGEGIDVVFSEEEAKIVVDFLASKLYGKNIDPIVADLISRLSIALKVERGTDVPAN